MSQSGFTPIQLYYSTTASTAPSAGNLANGELAINITDGKLFYKDNGGVVQVLATKGAGTIGGSNTQVQYNSSGALAGSANLTFNGTTLTANTLNLTNALGTAYGGTGLTSFTANGVVYASGAGTLATGSALTFDGTNLGVVGNTATTVQASSRNDNTTTNAGAKLATLYTSTEITSLGHYWDGSQFLGKVNSLSDLLFTRNNVEQMRLTSTGLGIGTSSPLAKLHVVGSPDATFNSQIIIGVSGATAQKLTFNPTLSSAIAGLPDGSLVFYGNGANTERARIDSSGNLLVGTTSSSAPTGGFAVVPNSNASFINIGHVSGTATGSVYEQFWYNSSIIGSITQSGTTAVLYNVTSDQRLKENIVDAPEFGSVIDSIKVRSYDWKADGSHQRAGFIAQELVTVAPEAVHQPEDPEEMMAVDYSKLVPMLVKELQSLRARVAQLEGKV